MKWTKTSEKDPFDLNGAEAISDKFQDPKKMLLYQICQFSTKENKKVLCDNCKTTLTIMLGHQNEIYNYELSKHFRLGTYKSIKEAKIAAEQFDELISQFQLNEVDCIPPTVKAEIASLIVSDEEIESLYISGLRMKLQGICCRLQQLSSISLR